MTACLHALPIAQLVPHAQHLTIFFGVITTISKPHLVIQFETTGIEHADAADRTAWITQPY